MTDLDMCVCVPSETDYRGKINACRTSIVIIRPRDKTRVVPISHVRRYCAQNNTTINQYVLCTDYFRRNRLYSLRTLVRYVAPRMFCLLIIMHERVEKTSKYGGRDLSAKIRFTRRTHVFGYAFGVMEGPFSFVSRRICNIT